MVLYTAQKTCPTCNSDNYVELLRKPWMHVVPGAKYLHCKDCHRDFISISPITLANERRKHDRFTVHHCLLVKLRTKKLQFGRISNIHLKGIGFSYDKDIQEIDPTNLEIDILNCFNGRSLDRIRLTVVWETTREFPVATDRILQLNDVNGRFKKLTHAQKKYLQDYLNTYKEGIIQKATEKKKNPET